MVYSDNKGIRDEMVKKYGLDNSKIGWDGKNVTYDNKYFMTPSTVSDGKSYAPQTEINRAVSKYFSNGDFGVRSALENRGVDTSKLGYDNGIITYNGKNLMKPDRVENGVSYVSNPESITAAAIDAHKANGKNIVKLTDYTANKQIPFNVGYANGMVSVNGQSIKPAFVDNGVAYVDSAELDKAIETAQKSMGIQDNNAIYEKYKADITPLYEQYIDLSQNREPFEYDYASDPVYQAYKEMYTREGDRVMRDVMGEYAANTGGYVNSAGITAGAQANNYYMQQLGDKIPQLFEAAYGRYNTDYINKLNALENIIGHKQNMFNTEYGVNNDIMNNIYANNALNQQREDNIYNRNFNEKQYEYEKALAEAERQKAAEADSIQRILQGGQITGKYNDWQKQQLAKYYGYEDGTEFDPFGAERNAAAVNYELESRYARPTYSSGGSPSKTEDDDGNVTEKKLKSVLGDLNGLNVFKNNSYVYKHIGEEDVPIKYNSAEKVLYWNKNIPKESQHSYKHPVLKALLEDDLISYAEMEEICGQLGIKTDDAEYDYLFGR